jgi:hypothetical protein
MVSLMSRDALRLDSLERRVGQLERRSTPVTQNGQ